MIDLTPLDVRSKRGDFRKSIRGYETQEVDTFLELVAERLEEVVRENLQMRERLQSLESQVASQTERESAVRDALVTAQELRKDIRDQARREAEKAVEDGKTEARRLVAEAEAEVRIRVRDSERHADEIMTSLAELERRRLRFLRSFRQLLEREMDVVEVEEARTPLEDRHYELDLGTVKAADRKARAHRFDLDDREARKAGGAGDDEAEGAQPLSAPRDPESLLLHLDDTPPEAERG
jgi:DivIVA domain-containing protein